MTFVIVVSISIVVSITLIAYTQICFRIVVFGDKFFSSDCRRRHGSAFAWRRCHLLLLFLLHHRCRLWGRPALVW